MKRARVIITEVTITKSGQMKHFQIKLPKNAKRIIAIETDIIINSSGKEGGVRGEPSVPTKI
jgi:hypothetical protein